MHSCTLYCEIQRESLGSCTRWQYTRQEKVSRAENRRRIIESRTSLDKEEHEFNSELLDPAPEHH